MINLRRDNARSRRFVFRLADVFHRVVFDQPLELRRFEDGMEQRINRLTCPVTFYFTEDMLQEGRLYIGNLHVFGDVRQDMAGEKALISDER